MNTKDGSGTNMFKTECGHKQVSVKNTTRSLIIPSGISRRKCDDANTLKASVDTFGSAD